MKNHIFMNKKLTKPYDRIKGYDVLTLGHHLADQLRNEDRWRYPSVWTSEDPKVVHGSHRILKLGQIIYSTIGVILLRNLVSPEEAETKSITLEESVSKCPEKVERLVGLVGEAIKKYGCSV